MAANPRPRRGSNEATEKTRPVATRAARLSGKTHQGLAVSPGVAVGSAYCIHEVFVPNEAETVEPAHVHQELQRYEQACEKTAADLVALRSKVESQVGSDEAAIFRLQESILRDPALAAKVRAAVSEDHLSAQAALRRVLEEYSALFARSHDEFWQERLSDVRDVIIRITGHLSAALKPSKLAIDGAVILIAGELVPSHVLTLGKRDVAGIVTQAGGRTSHAAILARSRGIPAVSGVPDILQSITTGDTVVVDGREGRVLVNPDYETLLVYRAMQRDVANLRETLAANCSAKCISADGQKVQLLANISNLSDAQAARRMGASGVGLYRTEYLFLTHADVPDEEEQLDAYRKIIAASPNRKVTIRTLDLGGDKAIPYLGHNREANPFMGWRSIRLSFEHPEFFLTQIRAILRAAAEDGSRRKQVQMMFPMITMVEELRKIHGMVNKACKQLTTEGKPFAKVPIGMMVEVPAAAVAIETMLDDVDFVSIGSNDLVQYLMAADRDNPKVSHLCQPMSPAVMRTLAHVIGACGRRGTPVTLCGEIAAMPRAAVLLFGMGLRSYSISPAFVPMIKELFSHLTVERAQKTVERVLKMRTTIEITRHMQRELNELCPNIKMLDSE
ncbi:MAG: phosphoenolpyruvate--protein phosphotransferase [Planctomycetes bacterium]|nr:phosphoenolpyruvate--protein phosphotransferase [Planctomycetota bacterium]